MAFPEPQPGLVIRYSYLWRSEAGRGHQEGTKDRPCVVVLAAKQEGDRIRVLVAPVTHRQPERSQGAIEIPQQTKERLKLDHQRSWVVTHEVNSFTWPGPDVRPVNIRDPAIGIAYGYLPHFLTLKIINSVRDRIRESQLRSVSRDE